jgi:cytochrome c oxidase subunit IV
MAQVAHDSSLHADDHHDDAHAGHPGERTYIKIAAILAVITIIEVAIYYIQWMHDKHLLVPALIALSAVKFFTVVSYFMHLKFDSRLLSYTFIVGLLFGLGLILAFMGLFGSHEIDYAKDLWGTVIPGA